MSAGSLDERLSAPTDRDARQRSVLRVLLVAVNAPIVVATALGLVRGYQPLSDDGILLVRAADVGTSHHPLLGSGTSASMILGTPLNNPGPLYFDAVAPWIRLFGPWVGLAVGVMLVNMVASSLAVVAARRISGTESMVAVAGVVVGLQWAMGSELLYDVWQPNALVLPALAFLVVVAVLATGDLAMAPWAVGLGSLLVQTHASHLPLVVGLAALAGAAGARAVARADDAPGWRRPLAWSAAVTALAWCQPVIEQLTGEGRGNLSRIVGAGTRADAPATGLGRATRMVAEVMVGSPWFRRASYDGAVPLTPVDRPIPGLVPLVVALLAVTVVSLALTALAVAAWRSGRRSVATMLGTSVAAIMIGLIGLAVTPVNPVGISAHQMRWLWPITAMATAAALTAGLAWARDRPSSRRAVPALVAIVALVAVANLPTHRSSAPGPVAMGRDLPAAQDLVRGLGELRGRGTVLFDVSELEFLEPYSGLVFAELQDQGVPFRFDDEFYVRQFGEDRRDDGSGALRMWQVEGPQALDLPVGAERVGFAEGERGPVALFVEPI